MNSLNDISFTGVPYNTMNFIAGNASSGKSFFHVFEHSDQDKMVDYWFQLYNDIKPPFSVKKPIEIINDTESRQFLVK